METSKVNFRLGCDPEVFLLNKQKLTSVVGLVKGDKANPLQIESLPKGFTLQQDNVALEFGIPPAGTREDFVKYIATVLNAGKNHLPGLSYSTSSCEVFPEDQMQTAEAHVFGCEPDFNAWNSRVNPAPRPPHPFMRSAGGHVHVETKLPPKRVVRNMDMFLGVPSVLMDAAGASRRQLYGKPGAHRTKPYGVEYRTLSNFWIFDPKLIEWVWNETARALSALRDGFCCADPLVRQCISEGDVELAKILVDRYDLKVA